MDEQGQQADEQGTGLPASFERAWGYRAPTSRGPKRGLSLDRIVDAAITVAAGEGLAAVSMGRVAKQLGAAPMSLYRYVAAKDELLLLMLDRISVPVPEPAGPGESWRDGLARWCRGYQDIARRNPWLLRIVVNAPPVTPNQTRWLESALVSMRDTGLRYDEKLSAVLLLAGFVRNMETLAADITAAQASAASPGTATGMSTASVGRALTLVAGRAEFPEVHAMLSEGYYDEPDNIDPEFTFGLERMLDGLEVLIKARARPGSAIQELPEEVR